MKPFLEEVAEKLVLSFGEELKDCAIIFNNKRPVIYLNNHLAEILQKPFWSPATFTIQEFLALSTDLKVADFYTQFFTLYDIFNKLLLAEGGSQIPMDKFFPIAQTILSDLTQIDMDNVPAQQLFKELEDIAVIDQQFDFLTEEQHAFLSQFWLSYSEGKHKKQQENFIRMWRRMPRLYNDFHRDLQQKGWITQAQVYRQLANGICSNPDFVQSYKKLIFVGFNALSQSEAIMFQRWQQEDKAIFFFDTDSYYLTDPLHEAGLFLRKNFVQYGLHNQLDNERAFLNFHTAEAHVYKVQGQSAQAKILNTVLQEDYQTLSQNPTYGDTAIILADESLLVPTLQTIPYEHTQEGIKGIPINLNMTMGISYVSSPLYGYADLWLTVQGYLQQMEEQEATVPYRLVELFLTHPLSIVPEHLRQQMSTELVNEQLAHIPLSRLLEQGGIFNVFFTKVADGATLAKGLRGVLEYTLRDLLQSNRLTEINANLFSKTLQELNRLHDTLQHYAQGLSPEHKFVTALIQQALQSIAVPLSGDPLSGLQVMGLLESRNLNFEHVVFVGMNDGTLPKNTTANSFIPDSLRRVFGLPVLENQDAISAYIFYRLVQRAKKVSFVYNSLTDESNTGEPSRFLKQLEYESKLQFHYHEQHVAIEVEKVQEREIQKTDAIQSKLDAYLRGERTLSASALTTYIANPLDFFFKEIAGIKEPDEINEVVEANHLGSILHQTLEDFYTALKIEDPHITAQRIREGRKNLTPFIEESFLKVIYPNRTDKIRFTGMQRVIMAIVAEYCHIILDFDEDNAPFTIIQMEEKMVVPFDFADIDGNRQTILLKGIIDRVQLKEDGTTQIVDYKTGSDKVSYKSLSEAFDTHSKNQNKALIQTLFYTYVFETAKQISCVEPNLYVVRKMKKDGTLFHTKIVVDENGKTKSIPTKLSAEFLASQKTEFLDLLRHKLRELFDPHTPFYRSQHEDNFRYSPYKGL
ncbi:PD-(D/E)XK nuclease family protein [Parapedobacter sp. SGR-10]|uniref:PD-(D/E)XK nuclease family protein n=1 Tax=Parapedobacter sp. SGR-10 TaxID=2710879 RepID=UPI0013D6DBD4|nr:PD-(D/E)XK nuclease family protein [Parapedobacter sp. SGR-10]NGF55139.1 PD-(D/E)XK nuclease family protein [Parapedobacter sp. SGR-10]